MPKDRLPENKALPLRWKLQHGAYYYRVPPGLESKWNGKKMFRLGKTQPEAYREWASRIEVNEGAKTVNDLLDRYMLEVIPTKAPKTQTQNIFYLKSLRSSFGFMSIHEIEPVHIYQYVDKRKQKYTDEKGKKRGGLVVAKREIEMFSDAFAKAVQWGFGGLKAHPFKGEITLEGEKARTRYVEDWEVLEFLSLKSRGPDDDPRVIHAYTKIKLLTGLRQQDILRLKIVDLKEDGIYVTPQKTKDSSGKSLIIEWSAELRAAVEEAKVARPVHITPYLFCNQSGACYYNEATGEASGWKSRWKRYMKRVLQDTKITENFTEHDLRAKCGSDADTREHARQLLGHTDIKMTEKVYRRKAERVKPLR